MLPLHLVGVWASEDAVLNGQQLVKGQALYLGADGVGAWMGGPPPVGFKVHARPAAAGGHTIDLDIVENSKVVGRRQVRYDPAKQTIEAEGAQRIALQRRSAQVSDATRKSLGL